MAGLNRSSMKINPPELLTDYNGNAVQHSWMLGGKTITVANNGTLVCESTLMRVCNSGTTLVRLKKKNVDYSDIPTPQGQTTDVGFPILPGTAIFVSVHLLREAYVVSGGSLDVTFCYDYRTKDAE